MKKITLIILFLIAIIIDVNAQDGQTCSTAYPITTGGTYTVTAIDGTEIPNPICAANGSGATAGEWYVYTPTISGSANLTTNLPANVAPTYSDDTRVHIYTGSCGSLTCYAANDDISTSNYLSDVTFNIISGTTYYIAFDDRWNGAGFDFLLTETAQSCLDPVLSFDSFTTTTVDFSTDTTGNFDIEWGVYPYTQGSGGSTATINNGDTYQLTGLTPGVAYNVFVRQDCGTIDGTSNYVELLVGTGPDLTSLPLSEDLEPDANQALLLNFGLSFVNTTGNWSFAQDDTTDGDTTNDYANSGISFIYSNSTFTDADSDATFYIGPFDLTTSNEYTFSFMQRNIAVSSATRPNKDIEIVVATSNDGTTNTVLVTLDDLDNIIYTQRTAAFTPTSDGSYYFGVRDKSSFLAAATIGNLVILDDLSITASPLSVDEFDTNSFSHYYNKDLKVLNLESSNLPLTKVEIYSVAGQTVLQKSLNNTTEPIDVSQLSNGLYMAKVNIGGNTQAVKFVKH